MKVRLFYLEADNLEGDEIDAFVQSLQQFMTPGDASALPDDIDATPAPVNRAPGLPPLGRDTPLLSASVKSDDAPAGPTATDAPADVEWTPLVEADPQSGPKTQPRSRRKMPASRSWSFEKFDDAVRAEIKRLGRNGELPTGTIWDRERSEELPTLTGVMRRYGCKNMVEFEEKLQAAPAASVRNDNLNGAAGRHL